MNDIWLIGSSMGGNQVSVFWLQTEEFKDARL